MILLRCDARFTVTALHGAADSARSRIALRSSAAFFFRRRLISFRRGLSRRACAQLPSPLTPKKTLAQRTASRRSRFTTSR